MAAFEASVRNRTEYKQGILDRQTALHPRTALQPGREDCTPEGRTAPWKKKTALRRELHSIRDGIPEEQEDGNGNPHPTETEDSTIRHRLTMKTRTLSRPVSTTPL